MLTICIIAAKFPFQLPGTTPTMDKGISPYLDVIIDDLKSINNCAIFCARSGSLKKAKVLILGLTGGECTKASGLACFFYTVPFFSRYSSGEEVYWIGQFWRVSCLQQVHGNRYRCWKFSILPG
jgi:hypothetical protein